MFKNALKIHLNMVPKLNNSLKHMEILLYHYFRADKLLWVFKKTSPTQVIGLEIRKILGFSLESRF